MRYALMTEPQQGLTYDEILAIARTAEDSGIEAYFRSDHYASFPGGEGLPRPTRGHTLAGLARETTTIRLGVLVSPVTFRIPGNLAKVIQTVDEMSGSRVEAGFGAGWNETEHEQLGIPFPPIGERYDMLEEQMAIIHGIWTEPDGWSYAGDHWTVRGSKQHGPIARGKRRHPHVLFGGKGGRRLSALVARYGDEFNLNSASPDEAPEAYARIRAACGGRARPRRPRLLGDDRRPRGRDRRGSRTRVADLLGALGQGVADPRRGSPTVGGGWIMGTPDEAMARVRALEATGMQSCSRTFSRDLDHVRLIGRVFR